MFPFSLQNIHKLKKSVLISFNDYVFDSLFECFDVWYHLIRREREREKEKMQKEKNTEKELMCEEKNVLFEILAVVGFHYHTFYGFSQKPCWNWHQKMIICFSVEVMIIFASHLVFTLLFSCNLFAQGFAFRFPNHKIKWSLKINLTL